MPPRKKAPTKSVPKTTLENEPADKVPIKRQGKAEEAKEVPKTTLENEPADEVPIKRQRKAKEAKEVPKTKLGDEPADEVPIKRQRKAKEAKEVPKTKLENKPAGPADVVPLTRQRKAKEPKKEKDNDPLEVPKHTAKTSKATTKSEKVPKKVETKTAPQNVTVTKWDELEFGCTTENLHGKTPNLKITSWNVDGLRAWVKKGGLRILDCDDPDIFCLQETKCSDEKLPEEIANIAGYHQYWCASEKEGYAGVGVCSKIKPLNVSLGIGQKEHDNEGRCITLEYKGFYLVNVYVPNSGRGLVTLSKRLDWNEVFKTYINKLDKKKPVILCGDMNVAHSEIDLTNPKTNRKNAGFTQEERDGMTDFLEGGMVDSFRELYPEQKDVYTFWSYMSKSRSRNIGWRLDYFIVSDRIMEQICDIVVRSKVYGSDHCPISLFLHI